MALILTATDIDAHRDEAAEARELEMFLAADRGEDVPFGGLDASVQDLIDAGLMVPEIGAPTSPEAVTFTEEDIPF